MIEFENDLPQLNEPIIIAAFEGWNDAGDAATAAIDHINSVWNTAYLGAMDPEDYYDFQVHRPQMVIDTEDDQDGSAASSLPSINVDTISNNTEMDLRDNLRPAQGSRLLVWPTTTFSYAHPQDLDRDVILVRGVEPNMRWRTYCEEILGLAEKFGARLVITLGALLADIPHSRPVPVTSTTSDPELVDTYNVELSEYEGPTGIVGVLQAFCQREGLDQVALWTAVPHYVAQPPSPKATLALLKRLEDLLETNIEHGDLAEDARAWQRGVDELAEEDSEIAEYITTLEQATDTTELPEASGEAIAREFEKYLRRRRPKAQ